MSENEAFQKGAAERAKLGRLGPSNEPATAMMPTDGKVLRLPEPDTRPTVRQGEVAATLYNELGAIYRRIQMADAFEKKVAEAAKSPAAWLLLREELNPAKDVTP